LAKASRSFAGKAENDRLFWRSIVIESNAWVIVPAKSFGSAKRRLSPLLSVTERVMLARMMLGDILNAIAGVPGLRNVAVVTSADDVADYVRQLGVTVIDDHGANSTNAAVRVGLMEVARRHGGAVIALPSDVPCILPVDISTLFTAVKKTGVAIAPAPRDGGTNALACVDPERIAPCFGPDSFARHIDAANRSGIRPVVVMNGRLGLDLDEPCHLVEFLDAHTQTQTDAYLRSLRLSDRMEWPADADWESFIPAAESGASQHEPASPAVWQ
jgi:2-phospho-L-lactate guanylyltransferase